MYLPFPKRARKKKDFYCMTLRGFKCQKINSYTLRNVFRVRKYGKKILKLGCFLSHQGRINRYEQTVKYSD